MILITLSKAVFRSWIFVSPEILFQTSSNDWASDLASLAKFSASWKWILICFWLTFTSLSLNLNVAPFLVVIKSVSVVITCSEKLAEREYSLAIANDFAFA